MGAECQGLILWHVSTSDLHLHVIKGAKIALAHRQRCKKGIGLREPIPFPFRIILQTILLFILKISLCNNPLHILANGLAVLLVQLVHVNRLAVFDHHGGLFYFGEMILKNVGGVHDGHGDDGDTALVCNLKAAVVEGQEGVGGFVAGTFREDADGNAALYFFDGFQNGLEAFLDVVSVQEEAVQMAHPDTQQGPLFVFLFGNVAGGAGNPDICQDDVKEAAVVGYVEDCGVGGDIFLTQGDHISAADPNENPKGPIDDGQGTFGL